MIGDKEQIARLQSDFYRDSYYKVIKWFYIEAVIMILLILAILYHIIIHPEQRFYATTTNGQLIHLKPS